MLDPFYLETLDTAWILPGSSSETIMFKMCFVLFFLLTT